MAGFSFGDGDGSGFGVVCFGCFAAGCLSATGFGVGSGVGGVLIVGWFKVTGLSSLTTFLLVDLGFFLASGTGVTGASFIGALL